MESDINVQKGHHSADKKMHGGQFTALASLLLGDFFALEDWWDWCCLAKYFAKYSVNYSVNYPLKYWANYSANYSIYTQWIT